MSIDKQFLAGYAIAGVSFLMTVLLHSFFIINYENYAQFLQINSFAIIAASLVDFRIWETMKAHAGVSINTFDVFFVDIVLSAAALVIFALIYVVFIGPVSAKWAIVLVFVPIFAYLSFASTSQSYRIDQVGRAMMIDQSLSSIAKGVLILLVFFENDLPEALVSVIFFSPFAISFLFFARKTVSRAEHLSGVAQCWQLLSFQKWLYGSLKALLSRVDSFIVPTISGMDVYSGYRGFVEVILSVSNIVKPVGNKLFALHQARSGHIATYYTLFTIIVISSASFMYFYYLGQHLTHNRVSAATLTLLTTIMSATFLYSILLRVKLTNLKTEKQQNLIYLAQIVTAGGLYFMVNDMVLLLLITILSIASAQIPILSLVKKRRN